MQSYQRFQHIVHTVFNTSGTNASHLLPLTKVGTHSALLKGSRTAAHTAKHGVFWVRVVSLPSARSARSRTSPGRVSERHTLPLLGLGRGCSRRTQRPRNSDALMRVAVPRRRGPAGLRDLFCFCRNCSFHALRLGLSARTKEGVVSLPSARFACC